MLFLLYETAKPMGVSRRGIAHDYLFNVRVVVTPKGCQGFVQVPLVLEFLRFLANDANELVLRLDGLRSAHVASTVADEVNGRSRLVALPIPPILNPQWGFPEREKVEHFLAHVLYGLGELLVGGIAHRTVGCPRHYNVLGFGFHHYAQNRNDGGIGGFATKSATPQKYLVFVGIQNLLE